jgi:hypothetical protein
MRQIIKTDSRVCVQAEEGLVFFPERHHQLREQRMLEYVGKVPAWN